MLLPVGPVLLAVGQPVVRHVQQGRLELVWPCCLRFAPLARVFACWSGQLLSLHRQRILLPGWQLVAQCRGVSGWFLLCSRRDHGLPCWHLQPAAAAVERQRLSAL